MNFKGSVYAFHGAFGVLCAVHIFHVAAALEEERARGTFQNNKVIREHIKPLCK